MKRSLSRAALISGAAAPAASSSRSRQACPCTAPTFSAARLDEQLGVQYRTAWHLGYRIRAILASGEKPILSGMIEAEHLHRDAFERTFRFIGRAERLRLRELLA
jgi:hypothetical protein